MNLQLTTLTKAIKRFGPVVVINISLQDTLFHMVTDYLPVLLLIPFATRAVPCGPGRLSTHMTFSETVSVLY